VSVRPNAGSNCKVMEDYRKEKWMYVHVCPIWKLFMSVGLINIIVESKKHTKLGYEMIIWLLVCLTDSIIWMGKIK